MGGALDQSHPCRVPGGEGGEEVLGCIPYVCVCSMYTCTDMYTHTHTHTHTRTHTHAHLHGMLQVPSGCTEAVDGVVLPNCVDPLTTRGHNT